MRSLLELPAFAGEDAVHVVVESPRGSTLKLKFDAKTGAMTMHRPLPAGLSYPHDWGFIPSTRAADGDPVDAFVMWDAASHPGVVIACRPIGVLRVEQTNLTSGQRERNDRIAALPVRAASWDDVRSVLDVSERARRELEQFFLAAVAFEGKNARMLGWSGPDEALALVRENA
jgi:inorganic pyrophosphatase